MSKKTYMIVSLLLAAIVGLAPGVYNLFNRTVQTQDDSGTSVPQTQGYVVLFLAAALCTLTGALAQLQLLKLLMHDIAVAGSMSLAMAQFWQYLFLVLQVLLWAHAMWSIIQTIEIQSAPTTGTPKLVAEGMQLASAKAASQPLPSWSLL